MTTAPDVAVRAADGNDLDALVEVGRRTWPATYGSIFSQDVVALFLAKWWTKEANVPAIRAGRAFVAEVGGRVVGMASYAPHEGLPVIWKLYVLPEHQGEGIGSRLLTAVLEHIGGAEGEVRMSVPDGNASAYDFARGHGFVEVHREPQGHMPAIIWMGRHLGSGAESRHG